MHTKKILQSPVLYKLLVDITVLWTLFVTGFFVIDFILPGILSLYIPVGVLFIVLIMLILCTVVIAKIQKITRTRQEFSTKGLALIILFIAPLVFLATRNFSPLMQLTIIALICAHFIYAFRDITSTSTSE